MGPHRFTVVPASLDGSANTLLELAGLLQAGHPELEMTGRMQGPAMPADLVIATRDYAEFAHTSIRTSWHCWPRCRPS